MNHKQAIELGYRLKLLRLKHRLKQKDLAEELGMASTYLYSLETGRKMVNIETLLKVVKMFNIGLEYFDIHKPMPFDLKELKDINSIIESIDEQNIQQQIDEIKQKTEKIEELEQRIKKLEILSKKWAKAKR